MESAFSLAEFGNRRLIGSSERGRRYSAMYFPLSSFFFETNISSQCLRWKNTCLHQSHLSRVQQCHIWEHNGLVLSPSAQSHSILWGRDRKRFTFKFYGGIQMYYPSFQCLQKATFSFLCSLWWIRVVYFFCLYFFIVWCRLARKRDCRQTGRLGGKVCPCHSDASSRGPSVLALEWDHTQVRFFLFVYLTRFYQGYSNW